MAIPDDILVADMRTQVSLRLSAHQHAAYDKGPNGAFVVTTVLIN